MSSPEVQTSEYMVKGDLAIIGMACIFPCAENLNIYWQNIVNKVDAITDVPPGRWNSEVFYDADNTAFSEGRLYSKRGGYLPGKVPFNPLTYGIMPVAVEGGEPDQFLVLQVAYEAMADAGYLDKETDNTRTEFILGRGNYLGGGMSNLIQRGPVTEQTIRILKKLHPEYTPEELESLKKEMRKTLPNFSSETAPAIIPNLSTGRVANRLGFMGPNYTIDAACASSLIAVELCIRDLITRKCDMALAGGAHIFNDIPFLMVFCALGALSPTSQIRPFDKNANGTMPGEGIGIVVLKRLEDAERDGDRIYAVVKGVGVSSDGRAVSVTAPRVEGEELALRRAYEMAGISPKSINLIEGHGTGTPAGDNAEIEALKRVFGARGASLPSCALGAVKSMIGHAMPAAGAAALIKTALTLYHKVLPPTLNCDEPNPKLKDSPFYVNTESRPWIHGYDYPRRAGVNAFGFGGINAHLVLEEYTNNSEKGTSPHDVSNLLNWETEVFIIHGENRQALIQHAQHLFQYLSTGVQVNLKDLAYTLNTQISNSQYRLTIVASSPEELQQKIQYAVGRLEDNQCKQIKDLKGIYYFERSDFKSEEVYGKLAFLFSGEGSQYVNMLSDLCIHFSEVRECFDIADRACLKHGKSDLPSQVIFPPPFFSEEERLEAEKKLWQMDRATEAVLTVDAALYTLLSQLGIKADMMAGHSAGEWSAMVASGIIDSSEFIDSLHKLNSIYGEISNAPNIPAAVLAAVGADASLVSEIIDRVEGEIYIADDNCPHQVVIAGEEKAVQQAFQILRSKNMFFEKLPFNRGYHTPMFAYILEPLSEYFSSFIISPPKTEIYSVSTASPYPRDPDKIRELAVSTWVRPVEFSKTIEAMYEAGARIFVEVGPKGNLIGFVDDILRGKPHLAVASNVTRRSGITQLNHLVGMLAASGVPMRFEYLYERRNPMKLTLQASKDMDKKDDKKASLIELSLGFPEMDVSPNTGQEGEEEGKRRVGAQKSSASVISVPRSQVSEKEESVSKSVHFPQRLLSEPPKGAAEQRILNVKSEGTVSISSRVQVMQHYLQTMENFLEVQQEVMQVYLTGDGAPAIATDRNVVETPSEIIPHKVEGAILPETLLTIPSASPAPTMTTLEPELQKIDAQVSKESPPSEEFGAISKEGLTQRILELVSEKTGYPQDMLDLNLDMEADLGIDSIKRIEILGAFQEEYPSEQEEVDMEQVASLKTLQQVIEFLFDHATGGNRSLPAVTFAAQAGETTTVEQVETSKDVTALDVGSRKTEVGSKEVFLNNSSIPKSEIRNPKSFYPLIGSVIHHEPGQKLVAVRYIDLDDDLFLVDHVFGREISDADSQLLPLPVIPMTISVEMMAEAAALLMSMGSETEPPPLLTGMKDIRAYQWIQVEESESPVPLEITATKNSDSEVEVQIQYLAQPEQSNKKSSLLIEGKAIFGDTFPEPPLAEDLPINGSRKPRVNAEQFYSQHWMFHGPRFQGVVSLDKIGEDGIDAHLEVLPTDVLFRNIPNPSFIIDPFLLDAAGQLVGYWPLEHFDTGFIIFPIRIKELRLYGSSLPPSERVKCQMQIRQVTQRQVRADMNIIKEDGRIWMHVIGWEDWRFYWPVEFHYFWRFPNKGMVSVPVSLPLIEDVPLECCRMGVFGEVSTTIWENVWAHLILNRQEREVYWSMKNDKRRTEWLFGRTAAKDAVRLWLKKHYQKEVYPADIYIKQNENGCPIPEGEWVDEIGEVPSLSIAHADEVAFAAAGPEDKRVGIDIERISERGLGFEKLAFTEEEQTLIAGLNDRPEWITRFWCAKEAVSKALGCGLAEGPRNLAVREVNKELGVLKVSLSGKLADEFPGFANNQIQIYTIKDEDYIISFTTLSLS